MKKLVSPLMLFLTLFLAMYSTNTYAQQEQKNNQPENTVAVEEVNVEESGSQEPVEAVAVEGGKEPSFTQKVKRRFIEGGVF